MDTEEEQQGSHGARWTDEGKGMEGVCVPHPRYRTSDGGTGWDDGREGCGDREGRQERGEGPMHKTPTQCSRPP